MRSTLTNAVRASGLEVEDLYSFNALGIPGWWIQGRRRAPGLSAASLAAYELLLRGWRPVESRARLPWGLSLIAQIRKPS
jgi:hypothetical protein